LPGFFPIYLGDAGGLGLGAWLFLFLGNFFIYHLGLLPIVDGSSTHFASAFHSPALPFPLN
jgi:hypothetical protein